ncbi:4'-phosphopantetheine phosphatase-like isoform X2 [Convolutriloba macropyga]|uniref:4'-phosphopantetheine phosphatase-like isoform X2 n=1 Tax=Convolutriloba macropyga TaxID=536237 RepID=UPI003F523A9D
MSGSEGTFVKSINVPNQSPQSGKKAEPLFSEDVFRNLRHATRFAIDIGGSLAKVVYISKVRRRETRYSCSEDEHTPSSPDQGSVESSGSVPGIPVTSEEYSTGFRLHFIKAETKYIEQCLEFLKSELVHCSKNMMKDKVVKATGGGALKYAEVITSQLGCKLDAEGEMDCIVKGCDFLIKNIRNEVFEYKKGQTNPFVFHNYENVDYPYLLVNIGSGVSILEVSSPSDFKRIGGTAMGGGTFWGIGSLLTNAKGFDELLELSTEGHSNNVDMLVKDIYGRKCDKLGLPGDLTASSFGKTVRGSRDEHIDKSKFSDSDKAKSLLHMISNGIGQIACLYARIHNVNKIYFGGYFIRNNRATMHTISFAVDFFSDGSVKALFLRHEGYLGAIGAFLKGTEEEDIEKYSWDENYMFDTSFNMTDEENSRRVLNQINMFELDSSNSLLEPLPLLRNPELYVADTFDLAGDKVKREFWLSIFRKEVDRMYALALGYDPLSTTKAELYKKLYSSALDRIEAQPLAQGSCSVRVFLNLNQKSLRDAGYHDIFLQKKQNENELAKRQFSARMEYLNSLEGEIELLEIIYGALCGNFFDWGSSSVAEYFEPGFGFSNARELIEPRPWLIDNFEELKGALVGVNAKYYQCALIFVDNSGFDLFLGILPLALYLIRRKTKVILASNTYPALNDVTFVELKLEIGLLAGECDEIKSALDNGMLLLAETGSYSPCLDLSRIDYCLVEMLYKLQTDLVILTGMGRAIHTNLKAEFSCDALKIAVIKNRELGRQMGGCHKFSVVCKFEQGSEIGCSV